MEDTNIVFADRINHLQSELSRLQQVQQSLVEAPQAVEQETALACLENAIAEIEASLDQIVEQQTVLIESQALLATERQRYQDIFERSPGAQLLTDPFGIVLEVNQAAQHLFRLSKSFLVNRPIATYFAAQNRRHLRGYLNHLRLGASAERWEDALQFASGDHLSVEVNVITVSYGSTQVLHWWIRDITLQKRAETLLIQANETLEQRIQERLQELVAVNAQLNEEINFRRQAEEALHRRMQQERLMLIIANKIRQSLNLEELLQTAVDEIRQFLQVGRVLVYQVKSEGEGEVSAESIAPHLPQVATIDITDPCLQKGCTTRYQSGAVRAVANVEQEITDPCLLKLMERLCVRAMMTVPILQGAKLWGLLLIHECRSPRQWHSLDIELMQNLVTQLAIAIQQSELYEQVQRLATTDALTQVANRYRLEEYLEQTWQRLLREAAPLSFIMCDIDYFKQYNDAYGHPAGDRCLQQVAQILNQFVQRPADLVARYGGEEFAIVLPSTDLDGAKHIVTNIQRAIADAQIELSTAPLERITLSYGIVKTIPTPDKRIANLIQAADGQLYRAKIAGRNQWATLDLDQ